MAEDSSSKKSDGGKKTKLATFSAIYTPSEGTKAEYDKYFADINAALGLSNAGGFEDPVDRYKYNDPLAEAPKPEQYQPTYKPKNFDKIFSRMRTVDLENALDPNFVPEKEPLPEQPRKIFHADEDVPESEVHDAMLAKYGSGWQNRLGAGLQMQNVRNKINAEKQAEYDLKYGY